MPGVKGFRISCMAMDSTVPLYEWVWRGGGCGGVHSVMYMHAGVYGSVLDVMRMCTDALYGLL